MLAWPPLACTQADDDVSQGVEDKTLNPETVLELDDLGLIPEETLEAVRPHRRTAALAQEPNGVCVVADCVLPAGAHSVGADVALAVAVAVNRQAEGVLRPSSEAFSAASLTLLAEHALIPREESKIPGVSFSLARACSNTCWRSSS